MIKLEHISKWVNQGNIRNFILKDINLQISEGEFISVMGPFRFREIKPSEYHRHARYRIRGRLPIPGTEVFRLKEKQRSNLYKTHIGFVFQAYHLIDELTVYENIETPLIYQDIKSSERKAIVADISGPFSDGGKERSVPYPAFRGPAATRGHRPGAGGQTQTHSG